MDTTALEAGYRALLETAKPGGFREPSDRNQWPAELLLAHVAANDRMLTAATAEVLAGEPTVYDNSAAARPSYLAAIGRSTGDWEGLVAEVRRCGLELVLLVRQLDEEQAATAVQTKIVDNESVRMQAPMPWSGVLRTHAEVDLPARCAALAALK